MRHELYLARVGFAALAAVAVVAAAVGAAVAGTNGIRSALIGAGLVAANHAVAVASTGWSATITPRVVAVSYGVFVVRLLLLLAAFGFVATFQWMHDAVFAMSFCAALVASLVAECISYARGSYVPGWMRQLRTEEAT